ncbi:Homeodomain-only protein, partial [Galemys pyrenaicus]
PEGAPSPPTTLNHGLRANCCKNLVAGPGPEEMRLDLGCTSGPLRRARERAREHTRRIQKPPGTRCGATVGGDRGQAEGAGPRPGSRISVPPRAPFSSPPPAGAVLTAALLLPDRRARTMSAETASGPTEDQVEILEYNFNKVNKHPDPTTLCLIAAEAGLSEEETQKWFKQRLAQWRRSEGLPSECRSVTD